MILHHSNIGPNLAPLGSRSLKVKFDSAIELPIFGFLLMFSSIKGDMISLCKTLKLSRLIYEIKKLQNLSDLDFDLSRSLKVKSDSGTGLPIYGFLLMFNSNIGSN